MTISVATTRDIVDLLEAGAMTHRQIAAATGVGYTTVGNIRRRDRKSRGMAPNPSRPQQIEEEFTPPSGPFVWCRKCRKNVKMPCVACQARAWRAEHVD